MRAVILLACLMVMSSCGENEPQEEAKEEPKEEIIEMPYSPKYDLTFLLGQFEPAEHVDFVLIDEAYANKSGMYMQKEAYNAFLEMHQAAKEDGVDLKIVSAARSFDYQKGIWERKWFGKTLLEGHKDASQMEDEGERAAAILRYSAMPGTSRHHWGTDIDLNALSNDYFSSGRGLQEFEWLTTHAGQFGFCRPYTDKSKGRTGYEEEKWHWSYLPLSKTMTHDCEFLLKNEMIQGFAGSAAADKLNVKLNYILGIDTTCL